MVECFTTMARIEKAVWKLIDDGKELDTLMMFLLDSVALDIKEESGLDLKLDQIKQRVSGACNRVYKALCQDQAITV